MGTDVYYARVITIAAWKEPTIAVGTALNRGHTMSQISAR